MAPGRKVLEDCGIRFEVEPEHVSTLLTYVEDLRDLLLNFRQIIPTSEVSAMGFSLEKRT